jgi:hypothetical protein
MYMQVLFLGDMSPCIVLLLLVNEGKVNEEKQRKSKARSEVDKDNFPGD